jgi:hypothetical protein
MFPRDHRVIAFNNSKLENLERGAEIVMQAQYVTEKQSGPFPMKLSSRGGAAQCRESSARASPRADRVASNRRNRIRSAIFLWQNLGASFAKFLQQSLFDLSAAGCHRGGRQPYCLIAAIRLALATLDRKAGRTTVPGAPSAADGTSIGLTGAALHRIA